MTIDSRPQHHGALGGSLFGLLAELWVLSNRYEAMWWPDTNPRESMQLANEKDIGRIENWAGRIRGIQAGQYGNVKGGLMRRILRQCGKEAPTILYLNGHTAEIQGERTYLPSDCCGSGKDIQGISFTNMRNLLLGDAPRSSKKTGPLLAITDSCDFTNFLELPFALRLNGKHGYWEKTEYYREGSQDGNRRVLHFASTQPGAKSFEFGSTGGIFTRAFCNVPMDKEATLVERSAEIQLEIDEFLCTHSSQKQIVPPITQQHAVYSSCEFDLHDKNPFESFGFRY